MHVITGGAYNGKTEWVKNYYQSYPNDHWFHGYHGERCPVDLSDYTADLLVISGMEQFIHGWLRENSIQDIRAYGKDVIQHWLQWEQGKDGRQIVVIGTDISKGIVPMDKQMRLLRDVTGWFYQDLVTACERFDHIWYGIATRLK